MSDKPSDTPSDNPETPQSRPDPISENSAAPPGVETPAAPPTVELDKKGCWQLVGAGCATTIFVFFVFVYLPIYFSDHNSRVTSTVSANVKIEVAKGCLVQAFRVNGKSEYNVDGRTLSLKSLQESLIEANISGEVVKRRLKLPPGDVTLQIGCKPARLEFKE